MGTPRFEGTYTALVTPFRDEPQQPIDWEAFDALIEAQVKGGVTGIVPCGTTGESPTLTHEENQQVIARAVKRAAGRVQVIAGTGTNATRSSIDAAREAERAGADAVMVVVPYYSRPSQEGLVRHFVAVAQSVSCPVVVYNIPGRCSVDLGIDALARIIELAPNVVATKEATGSVVRAQEHAARFGDRLAVLSGDDALTLPMMAVGGKGVISVTSNVLPAAVTRATKLALAGDFAAARRAHLALLPVHQAMFVDANPVPVKAALALRPPGGVRMSDTVRSPHVAASESTRTAVAAALDAYASRDGDRS